MPETTITTQAAALFQKAHGKIVTLQRLDSQLTNLLGQRQRVHAELAEVQSLISNEMLRVVHESNELPSKVLSNINEYVGQELETASA